MNEKQEQEISLKAHSATTVHNLENTHVTDDLSLKESDAENSRIEAVRLGKL